MKEWLRAKLRLWLGIDDADTNINALAVSLKLLIERVDACESSVILSADLKSLQERVTMLETAHKSVKSEEKQPAVIRGGWSSQKRTLQKDSEWPH